MNAAPYAAAAGAILAAELISGMEPKKSSDIPTTKEAGYDAARSAAAREMPCGVERFLEGRGGTPIRTDASGGEDFIREATIQRNSLLETFGPIGGALLAFLRRPAISARCARQWIQLWLGAWQVAHGKNRKAFAVYAPHIVIPASVMERLEPPSWHEPLRSDLPLSGLGKAVARLKELELAAAAATAPAIPLEVQDARPWLYARTTTEAVFAVARELDAAGLTHGDAAREALDELRSTLSPGGIVSKAADAASSAAELAVDKVIGPAVAAIFGVVLPYAVLGLAIYVVVRKGAA